MRKNFLLIALSAGAILLGGETARAQSSGSGPSADPEIQAMRKDLRSEKKQIIAANLTLTDSEAERFWPVYDRYAADLSQINDQRYALVKEYAENWGKIDDHQALSLSKRSAALDQQVAQLRASYLLNFSEVVPGTKAATFLQLDRRIQELIDLQLASQLPLIQEQ